MQPVVSHLESHDLHSVLGSDLWHGHGPLCFVFHELQNGNNVIFPLPLSHTEYL